jgi:hypothetical protein
MKRHGNLWQQVISFDALLRAADKARKPSQQSAFDPRNQDLLLLDVAGGFEDRLQAGEELVGRLDRVGQN